MSLAKCTSRNWEYSEGFNPSWMSCCYHGRSCPWNTWVIVGNTPSHMDPIWYWNLFLIFPADIRRAMAVYACSNGRLFPLKIVWPGSCAFLRRKVLMVCRLIENGAPLCASSKIPENIDLFTGSCVAYWVEGRDLLLKFTLPFSSSPPNLRRRLVCLTEALQTSRDFWTDRPWPGKKDSGTELW